MMNDPRPMVALTFDDGPSEYTDSILDAFRDLDCHATFCEVGEMCERYPEQLKRTAAEGHELACHSWNHPNLTQLSPEEQRRQIGDTCDIIRKITGQECAAMRPPFGATDAQVNALIGDMGMTVLIWSMSTDDWAHNDADKTFAAVRAGACDGAVILCHDRSSTAKAVSMMVPWLREQGYRVGSLKELLESKSVVPAPGTEITLVKKA